LNLFQSLPPCPDASQPATFFDLPENSTEELAEVCSDQIIQIPARNERFFALKGEHVIVIEDEQLPDGPVEFGPAPFATLTNGGRSEKGVAERNPAIQVFAQSLCEPEGPDGLEEKVRPLEVPVQKPKQTFHPGGLPSRQADALAECRFLPVFPACKKKLIRRERVSGSGFRRSSPTARLPRMAKPCQSQETPVGRDIHPFLELLVIRKLRTHSAKQVVQTPRGAAFGS